MEVAVAWSTTTTEEARLLEAAMIDDKRLAEIERWGQEIGSIWTAQKGTGEMLVDLVAEVRRLREALNHAADIVHSACGVGRHEPACEAIEKDLKSR